MNHCHHLHKRYVRKRVEVYQPEPPIKDLRGTIHTKDRLKGIKTEGTYPNNDIRYLEGGGGGEPQRPARTNRRAFGCGADAEPARELPTS